MATRGRRRTGPDRRVVFISYAREDSRTAEWIRRGLESSHGWDVWMDVTSIDGARAWAGEIETAIGAADVMLLLHSSHAAGSVMVERELSSAAAQSTPIVVAELEDVAPTASTRFLVRSRQFVPVSGPSHDNSGSLQIQRLDEALLAAMLEKGGRQPSGARLFLGRLLSGLGGLLMILGFVGFGVVGFVESQDPDLAEPFSIELALTIGALLVGMLTTAIGRSLKRSARMRALR